MLMCFSGACVLGSSPINQFVWLSPCYRPVEPTLIVLCITQQGVYLD
jgi:hypothetical protein